MFLFLTILPIFNLSSSLIYTLVVIKNIFTLILLFSLLWWVFSFIFAYIITNTWGYRLRGFRNLSDGCLYMLATLLIASNETTLSFENEQLLDKVKFLILNILVIYTLRFCIACQMTSLVIEQNRKITLKKTQIHDHYKYMIFESKQMWKDWLWHSFCFFRNGPHVMYDDYV